MITLILLQRAFCATASMAMLAEVLALLDMG